MRKQETFWKGSLVFGWFLSFCHIFCHIKAWLCPHPLCQDCSCTSAPLRASVPHPCQKSCEIPWTNEPKKSALVSFTHFRNTPHDKKSGPSSSQDAGLKNWLVDDSWNLPVATYRDWPMTMMRRIHHYVWWYTLLAKPLSTSRIKVVELFI